MRNHKYHYLYKITNQITGQYYYGAHSTDDLNDGYFGSGSNLKTNIIEYGRENFIKENLEFFNTRRELMKEEKRIVNYEKLKDPLCLNVIIGGGELKGSVGKKCVVDDDGNYIMVDKDINDYKGFMTGRICINKDGKMKYIKYHELDYYRSNGWEKGTIYDSPGKGKIWVCNDEKNLQINPNELDNYINNGWKLGMKNSGKNMWVNKNGKSIVVNKIELNNYINEGWSIGFGKATVNNRICVVKNNNIKYINSNELDDYINNGWKSRSWGDIIWINKSNKNKRVKKSDLQTYINNGWVVGRYHATPPKARKLLMYDLNGNKIKEFIRVSDAVKQGYNNISKYANKNKIYMGKYILKYDN